MESKDIIGEESEDDDDFGKEENSSISSLGSYDSNKID